MVVLPELTQTPIIRSEEYGAQHSLKELWVFLKKKINSSGRWIETIWTQWAVKIFQTQEENVTRE